MNVTKELIKDFNEIKINDKYIILQKLDFIDYTDTNYIDELNKSNKLKEERKSIANYNNKNNINRIINLFPYNLKDYINERKLINFKISNAFNKLYEILTLFSSDFFKSNEINTYHMAEAPGQWIKTFEYFTGDIVKYNWYSNSLNPNNEIIKKKYNTVFNDLYGVMSGKNKNKWLYGLDDTGDITVASNILHIKENIKFDKIDIITSDAGIDVKNNTSYMLQKLDYAQLVNVIILSNKGTNIIMKTFLPFVSDYINSNYVLLFISILQIYHYIFEKIYLIKPITSNYTSGEFYIIGINYKNNINNDIKKKMLIFLDNFNVGIDLVKYFNIPIKNSINNSSYSFFNELLKFNNKFIFYENILFKRNLKDLKHVSYELKSFKEKKIIDYINVFFNSK